MWVIARNNWRPFVNRSLMCQQSRLLREHRSNWFPGETQDEETDIPFKKTFDPTILIEQTKLFIQETKDKYYYKKVFVSETKHDEVLIQWKFDNPEAFNQFNVAADSDSKQGYSRCELLMSKQKTAIFRGNIVNKPPKDGKTTYAGYAAMKSKRLYKSFFRADTYSRWAKFTHFLIKVRGDGRKYAIILNTPSYSDISYHDYYKYPLFTHGGPYWQYHKIPFSKFYKEVHTKIQMKQEPVLYSAKKFIDDQTDISSIAISLFDRVDGPFNLEIDFIGVYKDETHFEEFAYESYKAPFVYL